MSTLKVAAIQDASGGNTATINSMTPTADSLQGFRNRIINGDMRIAQRGTAAVTVNSGSDFFAVDRFAGYGEATDGVYTLQQSSTAPTGFVNSLIATVTTADASVGSGQYYFLTQRIEGTNVSDLGFGTASAKTVTLSFWVRSSLTGQFGGSLANSAFNRSYPFTYTINSANTWEQKFVTIAGDTSGTWLTTTGIGLRVYWNLGSGSSNIGTAGAWAGEGYVGATGDTKLISTLNATWYITGVQLEVGSTATPFERRPYGTELSLCQRYYSRLSAASSNTYTAFGSCVYTASGNANGFVKFPNTMRASATISYGGNVSFGRGITLVNITGVGTVYSGPDSALWQPSGLTGGADKDAGVIMANDSATAFVAFSSEL